MKILMMNAQKGGVGKTYLTMALGTLAARAGVKVAVLDMDKQGSFTNLLKRRDGALVAPEFYDRPITPEEFAPALAALRQENTDLVIVDTQGATEGWMNDVMAQADLVLIPTNTTMPDILAIDRTQQIVRNSNRPFAFVISKASTKAKARLKQATDTLGEIGPVMHSVIYHRSVHEFATDNGQTAADSYKVADAKGRNELAALWKEVKEMMNVQS